MDKNIGELNGKKNMIQTKTPLSFITLGGNAGFCTKLFSKASLGVSVDPADSFDSSENLVYDFSKSSNFDAETLGTIIDLLMQLRAAVGEGDQTIMVQNNTVLREQIVNQLKNEILKNRSKLTQNQIENLKVISSNSFDEKTLTDILKSLLSSSKKKSDASKSVPTESVLTDNGGILTSHGVTENVFYFFKNTRRYSEFLEFLKNPVAYKIHNQHKIEQAAEKGGESAIDLPERQVNARQIALKKDLVQVQTLFRNLQNGQQENVFKSSFITEFNKKIRNVNLKSVFSHFKTTFDSDSFVKNILFYSSARSVLSSAEMVNKIFDKSSSEILQEAFLNIKNQYNHDKQELSRIVSKITKQDEHNYTGKKIAQSAQEILNVQTSKIKNLYEQTQKNRIKLSKKNQVETTFEKIHETETDENIANVNLEHRKAKDINNVNELEQSVNIALSELENIKKQNKKIERKYINTLDFAENLLKNVELSDVIASKKTSEINMLENNIYNKHKLNQNRILRRKYRSNRINEYDNIENFEQLDDKIFDQTSHITYATNQTLQPEINTETLKKDVVKLSKKNIRTEQQLIRKLVDENKTETTKYIKNIFEKSPKSSFSPGESTSDVFEYHPLYYLAKHSVSDTLENIISENVFRLKNLQMVKHKDLKRITKNVYKDILNERTQKKTITDQAQELLHLVNLNTQNSKTNIFEAEENNAHMVYKQNPLLAEPSAQQTNEQTKINKHKASDNSVNGIVEHTVKSPALELKKVEQNIMSKVLSKNDVENMIKSHMNNINVDAISAVVMDRVEEKMTMDNYLRGIF